MGNGRRNRFSSITIIIGLAVVFSIGCSKQPSQWRQAAPQSESDLGYIVENVNFSEINSLVKNNPEITVRVISKKHSLYEVYNITKQSLKNQLTSQALIEKNQMVQVQSNSQEKNLFELSAPANTNSNNPLKGLCSVFPLSNPPVARVNVEDLPNPEFEKNQTMNLSQNIEFSLQKSENNLNGELDYIWFSKAPNGAMNYSPVKHTGLNLEFQPETLGTYYFVALVRDQRGACSKPVQFTVGVTKNPELEESVTFDKLQQDFDNESSFNELFFHLKEINAQESWKVSKGDGVKIAILDTGVNYNHPAINKNIFTNPNEIPDNGIDDDDNGYIDDKFGYDFINKDSHPYDDNGHGSHVAGLAASPVFGTAKNAKIIPIKVLSHSGSGDLASIVGGMLYASDIGADILNLSLGIQSERIHPTYARAIDKLEEQGILMVVAAGNGDMFTGKPVDIDLVSVLPASLPNSNILTVAASNTLVKLSPFSNYGVNSVDIVAPGGSGMYPNMTTREIYSAMHENQKNQLFQAMSGTSMATPIVTGVAAQVLSLNHKLNAKQLRTIIMKSGVELDYLKDKIASGKHLDANNALKLTLFFNTWAEENL